jgi:NAD(P)-dependent dehydrogenase (short-subunit alcohol dehydrogenase family)
MSGLVGQAAVVTGGGRGIGKAVAARLARDGARVAIAGRDAGVLERAARELGALAVPCDVSREDEVERLVARVRAELGAPTIVVNNAGITHSAPFVQETAAALDEVMATNLRGTFLVTRAFLPPMLAARRGRVVCVASVAAKIGFKYTAAYSASKHAVLGLVRSLALEVADQGVTVNAVCPGWVESDMFVAATRNISAKTGRSEAEARAALAAMSPQKRVVDPEEVAAVVSFLCGLEAAGVTGQAWNVDGGSVMS